MKIVDKFGNTVTASDVDRLLSDPAFTAILDKIRSDQVDIFMQSRRTDAQIREDAHAVIMALDKIEQALKAVVTDEAIKRKREERTF